jgi:ribosomal silencing factor RsfS
MCRASEEFFAMPRFLLSAAALLPILIGGCAAKTAFDVVTFPVKATSKAVDWTTTSQSESDRNAGRKARKEREKAAKECRKHGGPDCEQYRDGAR